MCFGGGGPTEEEKKQSAEDRVAAEEETQKAVQERAQAKAEDIQEAISSRTARAGRGGVSGRRSLISSGSGGAGFLSRFG